VSVLRREHYSQLPPSPVRAEVEDAQGSDIAASFPMSWPEVVPFGLSMLVAMLSGVFFTTKQVTDPFLYYDVGFVTSLQGHMSMHIPSHGPYASLIFVPGREMLMLQLSQMLGIQPAALQFLPVGALILSPPLYLTVRKLTGSSWLALAAVAYLVPNLSHATTLYSIFAYALAMPLFLVFVIVMMRALRYFALRDIALAFVLYVAVELIHYTISAWCIVLLLAANGVIWLQRKLGRGHLQLGVKPMYYLGIAFVVVFFGFNETFYKSYLPVVGPELIINAEHRFLGYLAFHSVSTNSIYAYKRAAIIGIASTATLALIMIPIAVWVGRDLWLLVVRRSSLLRRNVQMPLIVGIVVVGIFDAITYSSRGDVSTKTFSMIFPIVLLYYASRLRWRRMAYVIAAVLVATSLFKVVIYSRYDYLIGQHVGAGYGQVRPSLLWMKQHLPDRGDRMLADLNLSGRYLVLGVHEGVKPLNPGFTPYSLSRLIGTSRQKAWSDAPEIIPMDVQGTQQNTGFLFQVFRPLRDYLPRIEKNHRIAIVYDDGNIELSEPTGWRR
jgi:hypothetical protein